MKQKVLKPTQSNATLQQKSAGLSLVIISSAALYLIASVWPMRPTALASNALPVGYGGVVLTSIVLLIVAQIVTQSVLVIGVGSAAPATVDEQVAALKARRNAYFVLLVGVLAAVGSIFVDPLTPFDTANLAILGLALAEIVYFASSLLYR